MYKQFGSVMLILGTCIGAAMLALPVVTAGQAFSLTTAMMLFAWAVMTIGAWTLLRVNLWMPEGSNLVTMTEKTLGKPLSVVTWIIYLLLLYSLICAYLGGASDLARGLLLSVHLPLGSWQATILAIATLGAVVYTGIGSVDYLNRALMSVKLGVLVVVMVVLSPHASLVKFHQGSYHSSIAVLMVMITSFGYAVILPSIRSYLHSDVRQLKRVVIIGSLVPLVIYLVWIGVAQSALPRTGEHGLIAMAGTAETNTALITSLYQLTFQHVMLVFGSVFVSICTLTSFLGVSVCLMDFLADGTGLQRKGRQGLVIFLLTYGPPFIIVLFEPGVFTTALAYAGAFCVYVLIILPVLMFLSGRKGKYAVESL